MSTTPEQDGADIAGAVEDTAVPGPAGEALADAADAVDDLPGGLPAALEAVLMVADVPVPVERLAAGTARPVPEVAAALAELAAEYRGERGGRPRGFDLREGADGWRVYSSRAHADVVGAFVLEGLASRLSLAALESVAATLCANFLGMSQALVDHTAAIGRSVRHHEKFAAGLRTAFRRLRAPAIFTDGHPDADTAEIDRPGRRSCREHPFFIEDAVIRQIVLVALCLHFPLVEQNDGVVHCLPLAPGSSNEHRRAAVRRIAC
jgi:hypothetical protein